MQSEDNVDGIGYESASNEALAQFKDMLSGIIAGGMAKIVEYPLDTIKILGQLNNPQQTFSPFESTKNLLRNEGIMRIYRGLSAPLFGSCLEFFTTFWMFSNNVL